jgi:hypothetical protein
LTAKSAVKSNIGNRSVGIGQVITSKSEAMEADRRGEGWDRVTEELADTCIRIFDLCGSMNLNLEKAILEKMEYNKTREYKHGGKSY